MRTKQKAKPRVTSAGPLDSLPRPIVTSARPLECSGTPIALKGIQCQRIVTLGKRQNDIDGTSGSLPSIRKKACIRQPGTNTEDRQKLQDVLLQRHVEVMRTHKRMATEVQALSEVASKKQHVTSLDGRHNGVRFTHQTAGDTYNVIDESARSKNCM